VDWDLLYDLSHAASPFCFSYFSDDVYFWGLSLDCDHSIYAFQVAVIMVMSHHAYPLC
jgi:hypothetical protein